MATKHTQRFKILYQLKLRNDNEKHGFVEIVHLTNALFEATDFHQKENRRLKVRTSKLKQDNKFDSRKLDQDSSTSNDLEKSLRIQEELTQTHKKKDEYVQQVLEMQKILSEKEKEFSFINTRVTELQEILDVSLLDSGRTQEKLTDSENRLQFVKDEYDALLLTYSCLEDKKSTLERENEDLISRMIDLKDKYAERLNAERENFQRLKQELLRRELEEAAQDPDG